MTCRGKDTRIAKKTNFMQEDIVAEMVRADCHRKGRLLPVAHRYAEGILDAGAREEEAWHSAQLGNNLGFLALGVGAVRMAAALTLEKIGFLHREPHILVRLGEAGVQEEMMRQWSSAAEEDHLFVTSEFLSDALKLLILGLPRGASELPAPLKAVMDSLKEMAIDGSVAEGSHAKAQRVSQATSSSGWSWIVSTMRLNPNLADAKDSLRTSAAGKGPAVRTQKAQKDASGLGCSWFRFCASGRTNS